MHFMAWNASTVHMCLSIIASTALDKGSLPVSEQIQSLNLMFPMQIGLWSELLLSPHTMQAKNLNPPLLRLVEGSSPSNLYRTLTHRTFHFRPLRSPRALVARQQARSYQLSVINFHPLNPRCR